ncbi:transcriptional regulator [Pseudomonas sp. CCI3.2]|uniref:helix-turn-helix domain-containing protein n=1 Tax=unclassified Pseudomonas TaxID=196821 RepID=UPI002AC9447F|nr:MULTISPECIES: transcriptional regulator [unclassified Pseudomonas]MEB0078453.1 transcriptional regulator [Pseudomonas sp. MH10out]MEB0090141.1 transcriptional regulator [Pseudomonas sp. CCI4.2]MEB0102925.1 transcriptional regulator [Pseudomonas sp. CCI3.2]MEB0131764.1 transcriptional regulator [Pseudomonas sp. CCI2.4]MEB0158076.1 transcriptional regulator [Pseudomonas sp. AH2 (2023)]
MNGIGFRLRKERERLGLSQRAFGKSGGVATNAQGKYEGGDRVPKAVYFAALTAIGVDVLFVLTGARAPIRFDNLSQIEQSVLANFRSLQPEDQDAVKRLTTTIADLSALYPTAG